MDDFAWATGTLAARQTVYQAAYDYYAGKHVLTFVTQKFRQTFGALLQAFADNLCPAVVDTVGDRLTISGFSAEGGPATGGPSTGSGRDAAGAAAWAIWQANRMDQRSREAHLDALVGGDAYLVVWPDAAGQPTLYPNAGATLAVKYDPETPGRIVQAAKAWLNDDGFLRLTLYYADRIEKWISAAKLSSGLVGPLNAAAFVPFEAAGVAWPVVNPWGEVPVFHFANNGFTGQLGRSELADVLPLQNALNKAVCDMLVAMEFVALPQRWVTGLEVELDPATGKPKAPFVPGVDRVWAVGAPDARFGEFGPANLSQLVAVQEAFRTEIARVSRTPLHYLAPSGEFPSGEALKTAEAPLLAKVKQRQVVWGNVWENALGLALRMAGGPRVRLNAQWVDPTPRNETEFLNGLAVKQALGVSDVQLQREMGYSADEIAGFAAERTAQATDVGSQLLTAFEQGAA